MKTQTLLVATLAALFSTACVTTGATGANSSVVYKEGQALSRADVVPGVVTSIQTAQIENNNGVYRLAGGVAGGVVGGALGNQVGGGSGKTAMTMLGALAGAIGGQALAQNMARTNGYVLTISLDRGGEMQVVQAADVEFSKGERVLVQKMGKAYRVMKSEG